MKCSLCNKPLIVNAEESAPFRKGDFVTIPLSIPGIHPIFEIWERYICKSCDSVHYKIRPARCRKDADGGVKTLQITGTLLRSAAILAAEELICLGNDRYGKCCHGEFKTVGDEKPFLLRKRPTLVTLRTERAAVCQSKEGACPLCLLLGRFDKAGKYHDNKGDYDIHFNNLNLVRNNKSPKFCK